MIFKPKTSRRTRTHSGCGFAGFVMLMVIMLMIVNALIAGAIFHVVMAGVDSRIVNPLQFITTVLLVFFEYWAYDQVTTLSLIHI